MTEIFKVTMGLEHALKQPFDKRYALFCKPVIEGDRDVDCPSRLRLGHISDYSDEGIAESMGIEHPHPVILRYYLM